MTTNTDPVRAHKPCGGCGNADPDKVCLGCRHDFGEALAAPPSALGVTKRELFTIAAMHTLHAGDYAKWEHLAQDAVSLADATIAALAAQQPEARGMAGEESRVVTSQLLHWNGIPVRVTGTVTTAPGNWSLIDAAQLGGSDNDR